MAQISQRGKAPDDTPSRPPIWAEGRQKPKFNLTAFATVAHDIAKTELSPVLRRATAGLARLGQRVLAGEWRITAAWAQRVLPSHQRVGAASLGFPGLMEGAGRLIGSAEEEPPVNLMRVVQPQAPTAEPTLQAIRGALRAVPHDPQPAPMAPAEPGLAHQAGSWVLLRVMMLGALPVGAVKAMIYHLEGGDLRDWS